MRVIGRGITSSALAAIIAASGACGSGEKPPTKSAFISRADAICRNAFDDIRGLPSPGNSEEVARYLDEVAELQRGLVERLRDLPKPADDPAAVAVLDDIADRGAALREAARAASDTGGGSQSRLDSTLAEGAVAADALEDRARAYGFVWCGPGPDVEGRVREGGAVPVAPDTTATTQPPDAVDPGLAAFATRADAECAEAAEARVDFGDAESLEDLGKRVEATLPVYRRLIPRLQGLAQPPEKQAELETFYATYTTLLRQLEAFGKAASKGDEDTTADRSQEVAATRGELKAQAGALGLKVCGSV